MGVNSFARSLGTSPNTVSEWFNTPRIPRPPQCFRIAEVLEIDPELVLEKAGHRPSRPVSEPEPEVFDDEPPVNFIQEEYERLTPEEKRELWRFIRFRREERKRGGN